MRPWGFFWNRKWFNYSLPFKTSVLVKIKMIVSGRKLSSMLIFAVNEQMAEWQRVPLADWKNEIRSVVFLTGSSFSKLIRKFCKPAWALDFNWRKSVSLFSGIILSFLSPLVLELLLVSICIRVRWALPLCLTLPESWPCVRPSVSCAEPGTGVGFAACHPGALLGLLCLPAPVPRGCKGWEEHPLLLSQRFVLVPHSTATMEGNNKTSPS